MTRALLAAAAFALALSEGHRDASADCWDDGKCPGTTVYAAQPVEPATKADIDALNRKLDIIAQCVMFSGWKPEHGGNNLCRPDQYPWKETK